MSIYKKIENIQEQKKCIRMISMIQSLDDRKDLTYASKNIFNKSSKKINDKRTFSEFGPINPTSPPSLKQSSNLQSPIEKEKIKECSFNSNNNIKANQKIYNLKRSVKSPNQTPSLNTIENFSEKWSGLNSLSSLSTSNVLKLENSFSMEIKFIDNKIEKDASSSQKEGNIQTPIQKNLIEIYSLQRKSVDQINSEIPDFAENPNEFLVENPHEFSIYQFESNFEKEKAELKIIDKIETLHLLILLIKKLKIIDKNKDWKNVKNIWNFLRGDQNKFIYANELKVILKIILKRIGLDLNSNKMTTTKSQIVTNSQYNVSKKGKEIETFRVDETNKCNEYANKNAKITSLQSYIKDFNNSKKSNYAKDLTNTNDAYNQKEIKINQNNTKIRRNSNNSSNKEMSPIKSSIKELKKCIKNGELKVQGKLSSSKTKDKKKFDFLENLKAKKLENNYFFLRKKNGST